VHTRIGDGVIQIDTLLGGWDRMTAGYLIEGDAPVLVETGSQSSIAVLLGSIGVVAMVVYAGGLGEVVDAVRGLDPASVALAVALACVAWLADALRYPVMAGPLGVAQPLRTWLAIAFVNQFGAYAVNAGAPAAAFVLAQRGIDGSRSFALALAKQSLFVPAVLGPMFVLLVIDPRSAAGPDSAPYCGWPVCRGLRATLAVPVAVAAWPVGAARVLAHGPVSADASKRFVDAISKILRARRTPSCRHSGSR
jgi:hypothetical protein